MPLKVIGRNLNGVTYGSNHCQGQGKNVMPREHFVNRIGTVCTQPTKTDEARPNVREH